MDMERIKRVAFANLIERRSHSWKEKGNKYYHGERVANLALTLRQILFPGDDIRDDILTVAAWFHDIENGRDDHCAKGAETTRKVLTGLCKPDELDTICDIIVVHDQRQGDRSGYSNMIKLHQDADLLDHFGIYDAWMQFLYAISHGLTLEEQKNYMLNERSVENAHYRDELNFELSRMIFDEKEDFMRRISERFAVETEGRIFDLDRILAEYRSKEGANI